MYYYIACQLAFSTFTERFQDAFRPVLPRLYAPRLPAVHPAQPAHLRGQEDHPEGRRAGLEPELREPPSGDAAPDGAGQRPRDSGRRGPDPESRAGAPAGPGLRQLPRLHPTGV